MNEKKNDIILLIILYLVIIPQLVPELQKVLLLVLGQGLPQCLDVHGGDISQSDNF